MRSSSPPPPYSTRPPAYHMIERQKPRSTLLSGQTLGSLQVLTSANGKFRLCMKHNGNLVLYSDQDLIWSSRTQNKGQPPYKLVMQEDNQLVIYDGSGSCIWGSQTNAEGVRGGWAKLKNTGSFVIFDGDGINNPLWCTRTDEGVKALEVHQGSGYKLVWQVKLFKYIQYFYEAIRQQSILLCIS